MSTDERETFYPSQGGKLADAALNPYQRNIFKFSRKQKRERLAEALSAYVESEDFSHDLSFLLTEVEGALVRAQQPHRETFYRYERTIDALRQFKYGLINETSKQ
jgi:hypothetical protein